MKSTISREEKLQRLKEEFQRMDTNGDNYIDEQELIYHLDMKNVDSSAGPSVRPGDRVAADIRGRAVPQPEDLPGGLREGVDQHGAETARQNPAEPGRDPQVPDRGDGQRGLSR